MEVDELEIIHVEMAVDESSTMRTRALRPIT